MNTNPMCRICYIPSCDWPKNLGYIRWGWVCIATYVWCWNCLLLRNVPHVTSSLILCFVVCCSRRRPLIWQLESKASKVRLDSSGVKGLRYPQASTNSGKFQAKCGWPKPKAWAAPCSFHPMSGGVLELWTPPPPFYVKSTGRPKAGDGYVLK